jgi:hypothetical protein
VFSPGHLTQYKLCACYFGCSWSAGEYWVLLFSHLAYLLLPFLVFCYLSFDLKNTKLLILSFYVLLSIFKIYSFCVSNFLGECMHHCCVFIMLYLINFICHLFGLSAAFHAALHVWMLNSSKTELRKMKLRKLNNHRY